MELHKYQKRIANHIAAHPHSILSVDMGLGKTAAVLAWLDWAVKRGKVQTALIVAPKRVAENQWKQEAEKWGWSNLANLMTICKGTKDKRLAAITDTAHPIKVLSRDNIRDLLSVSKQGKGTVYHSGFRFDALIVDELTSFKSVDAERTKALLAIPATYHVGLTGTFLANGAVDIYGQAAAVGLESRWGHSSFYGWQATYFRDLLSGTGLKFHKWRLKVSLEELLKPIAADVFTLTADDYLEIPPVTHITHSVEVGDEIRKAIEELDAFLAMELDGEVMTFSEKAKFAKLQTLVNGFVYTDHEGTAQRGKMSEKLEQVADFVTECKEAGEPVLLFYAFREEAVWLAELLTKRGVKFESVKADGFLDRWNNGETECLFAHPASAGHGLNLQHGGRTIVWSTLTYNYEYYAQANARLARQGQTRPVQVHYFIGRGTVEVRVVKALQEKDKEQKQFLNITKQ